MEHSSPSAIRSSSSSSLACMFAWCVHECLLWSIFKTLNPKPCMQALAESEFCGCLLFSSWTLWVSKLWRWGSAQYLGIWIGLGSTLLELDYCKMGINWHCSFVCFWSCENGDSLQKSSQLHFLLNMDSFFFVSKRWYTFDLIELLHQFLDWSRVFFLVSNSFGIWCSQFWYPKLIFAEPRPGGHQGARCV